MGVVAAVELEGVTVEMLMYDRFTRCDNHRNCKDFVPDAAASPPPAAAATAKLAPLLIAEVFAADAAVSLINRVSRPHLPRGSGLWAFKRRSVRTVSREGEEEVALAGEVPVSGMK